LDIFGYLQVSYLVLLQDVVGYQMLATA
jgi:hypothetical protein